MAGPDSPVPAVRPDTSVPPALDLRFHFPSARDCGMTRSQSIISIHQLKILYSWRLSFSLSFQLSKSRICSPLEDKNLLLFSHKFCDSLKLFKPAFFTKRRCYCRAMARS